MPTHQLRKAIVEALSRIFVISGQNHTSTLLHQRLVHDRIDLSLLFGKGRLVRDELFLVVLELLAQARNHALELPVLCVLLL